MPVCDICNNDMRWEDGYVLTTRQVATTEAYWEAALKGVWSATHAMDPEGDTLPMLVQQQAGQSSGWLICESCSTPFSFDKHQAKAHARAQNGNPPGAGSAPAEAVARAAATVWKRMDPARGLQAFSLLAHRPKKKARRKRRTTTPKVSPKAAVREIFVVLSLSSRLA